MGALEKSAKRMRVALLRRVIESPWIFGFNSNRLARGDSFSFSGHPFASARLNDVYQTLKERASGAE
jgi:hypothetical protein